MVELYGNQVLKNTLLLPQHMIYKKTHGNIPSHCTCESLQHY